MVPYSKWRRQFSKPGHAKTARVSHFRHGQLEILEDRTVMAAGVVTSYVLTQDWGSGFQGQIQVANQQSTSVANWQLGFDFAANITDIWDAKIVSHTSNHYVVSGAGWNNTISTGGAIAFGFVAQGSSAAVPANYSLNGGTITPPPPPLPTLSVGDVTVTEGDSGTTNAVFAVSLSAAATKPITVSYSTVNGSALVGSDYAAASGILTFAAGQTQRSVSVAIVGDKTSESDETFTLGLSSPSGATLARAQGTATIKDNDPAPASGVAQFSVTSDWGSGFTGQITVKNTGQQTIKDWRLEFDFAGQITSIWNASILSHTGNHYVIKNAGWNASIAGGATTSLGFNGSPGHVTTGPANYRLYDATSGGGSTLPTNHTPTPANDFVLANLDQAVTINVLANDTDPDGDALSVLAVSQAQHGAAVLSSDGTVRYTPTKGYAGNDAFAYTVSDGRGGTASANVAMTVGTPAAIGTWPARFYAPYVDITLYPTYSLATATQNQGVKYFTLAFITADSKKLPAWGGYDAYEINGGEFDTSIRQQVAAVRALGGDVMVSFGGAANLEMAQAITDVSQLTAAYRTVIDGYNLNHIDFDIEGAAVADHASIDRRSQALAAVQQAMAAAGRPLEIWYTLPVLPTGLTADGLYVVQSALRYGMQLAGVNVMTMDYGDGPAPSPQGHMGDYAIDAANSLFSQLKSVYGTTKTDGQLWQMVGLTPMIGVNDLTNEIFDQAAARQIVSFAQQKGISRISMWSLNRDTAGTAKGYVDNTSSSVTQTAFEFSHIFETL